LHTHAAEKKKLLEDPALITNAVEEILRYEPPAEGTARIAPRDMEIRGCPIKRSQVVVSSLRGANRDPGAFVEPDRFDISREHLPHVSFGGGSHICIGAPLARMEAQVALSAFLRHFPAVALEDPTPTWRPSGITRGLSRIDIRV
jgi:cytochrome P450